MNTPSPRTDSRSAVSVIIPSFNAGPWLGEQLDALSKDSAQPFDTVVVDNGSTDASLRLAQSFASRMPLVIVEATERRGPAFARNFGARVSTSDRLIFLDADDVVAPGYVSAMAEALQRSEIVAARMDVCTLNPGWRQFARRVQQVTGLPADTVPWATEPVPWGYGCSLGMRRDAFERIGGFAEDVGVPAGEDVDLCYRASKLGFRLAYVPDAVLQYRFRKSPGDILRQGRCYGVSGVQLSVRHGIALHTTRRLLRAFLGPLRLTIFGPSRGDRAYGLFLLGRRIGAFQQTRAVRAAKTRLTQLNPA